MKTYNVWPQDIRRALDAFESLYPWRLVGEISGNAFGDIILKINDDRWCFEVKEGKLSKLTYDNSNPRMYHWELVWSEEDKEDEAEAAAERESVGENWW